MFGHLDIAQNVGLIKIHKSLMDTSAVSQNVRNVKCTPIHVEPVSAIHVEISIVSKKMIVIMVSATTAKIL
jgi:hypothetical protein